MDHHLIRKKLMENATLKMKYLPNLNLRQSNMQNKYAKQTTLNTHALIIKNRYEVLCESGEEDCNKSVRTPVKILKQSPNEDLYRAKKKQPSLFQIHC